MNGTVFIVDDDDDVRDSLGLLIAGAGYAVEPFPSGEAFLAACRPGCAGCVLLDLAMPGLDGEQVFRELRRRRIHLPVVVLTGHGDIATAVRMVKAGAADFLQKPIEGDLLLRRLAQAMAPGARAGQESGSQISRARFEALTPREQDVMALTVSGLSNKEIARELGISHRTVEIHRARTMHKMGADSLVDLVSMAQSCGLAIGPHHDGGTGESDPA